MKIELIMWETVRKDCKYPESDQNNGFIYGCNLVDYDNDEDGEIVDVQWFKTNEERHDFIEETGLETIQWQ